MVSKDEKDAGVIDLPRRPLRVSIVASPALAVPPVGYGGTETVVHTLAAALQEVGCMVKVLAAGTTPNSFSAPVGLDLPSPEAVACELAQVANAYQYCTNVDLIHDHTKVAGVLLAKWASVPVLTTVHNDCSPIREEIYRSYPDHHYVFLSQAHADRYPGILPYGVVFNGIDLRQIPFRAQGREDYLLFLGRISAVKGAHEAIIVAQSAKLPLILAGPVESSQKDYFANRVAPHIDGTLIRLAGEVAGSKKWLLLAKARALLMPLQWEEPFGLVMIEAMACGTPVIAFARGAAKEVVCHGITGFLANDRPGLLEGIANLAAINPYECRKWVSKKFSATTMAANYLALYHRLFEEVKEGVS
ncbi:MAG: glycosyltransferase [Cyanobacteria bacterium NC_groundwater_1444_Ag_S-0.65um_54_12]|nr:glycosyltransferase [Cyanobacteria bacterium NC_groundwater_1444_Ag_S-0.65um_54_12]